MNILCFFLVYWKVKLIFLKGIWKLKVESFYFEDKFLLC